MNDRNQNTNLTRRSAFVRLGLTAGGGALLIKTVLGSSAVAASGKMSQASVGYQDSRQGNEDCENCVLFIKPASCKLVAGNISPGAWCKLWAKIGN